MAKANVVEKKCIMVDSRQSLAFSVTEKDMWIPKDMSILSQANNTL